ncbi:MAG: hypothetical protein ACREMY_03815, partial [bacterium]
NNAVGMRVEHPSEDVETARIVRDFDFGLESWIAVFLGIEFPEPGYGGRALPYWIVVATIDYWRPLGEHGPCATEDRARSAIGCMINEHILGVRSACNGKQREC